MPPSKSPPDIQQAVTGDDNIQVAGSGNVIKQIKNFFTENTEAQRAMRIRRAMLELVKNTWIKGVLEKSLYNEVLIELGMEERPGAVDHPWDVQLQMPNKENRTLPAGTSMMEVFDEMNGAMLILGEPGSGKTTMLLELARDCIDRAQQDDNQPIPVVFNLSSWDGKQTIDEWLVNELRTKYNVSKKVARTWVTNDDLLLLLDGLDEVKLENREECVKAINDFRQEHGLTMPIAVCSRIADYEALTTKLNLSGAVLLQHLTAEQVEGYFEQVGSELAGVHQILMNDEALQEMVRQPLILSILTLAYRGRSAETFTGKIGDNVEACRKHLFDVYIRQMFERVARTKKELYTPNQIKRWLTWLAQKMIEQNQVLYLLENMQPKWLDLNKRILFRFSYGLLYSLPYVLGCSLFLWPMGVWIYGLICGFLFWPITFLSSSTSKIETVDTLTWDWKKGGIGFSFGLVVGLLIWPMWGQVIGLGIGLSGGVVVGLISGLDMKPISRTTYPGERLSLSIRNYIIIVLILWVISVLIFWVIMGLFGGPGLTPSVLLFGLLVGLFAGLIGGLMFGGRAVIQHYILRLIIAKNNLLPFRLVPFLDYCVDRIFLRRVGGGYIFVHRLLMEHFAAMYPADEK